MSVPDCSSAVKRAHHIVKIEFGLQTIHMFSDGIYEVSLTFEESQLLVDKIENEIEGACTIEAGYVYIFMQSPFLANADGKFGQVYWVKGSSGDGPSNIIRHPSTSSLPAITEKSPIFSDRL